jgi:pilus assembly protein CpaF
VRERPGAAERLLRDLPALSALGVPTAFDDRLAANLVGAGPLEPLLADDRVTEIMVNGPSEVHVEIDGRLQPAHVHFASEHHLRGLIERLLAGTGRRLDESCPAVDAVLPDGTRLNAVLPPVAVGGPLLTLRRSRRRAFHLAELVRDGAVPRQVAAFLHAAVIGRCNVLVSGGAGAGKTSLLAALCGLVPSGQRIVTLEDVAELRIDHPHVVAQQCRDRLNEAVPSIDMRALLRNTLRMRPDRIVVGEVRGAEAADMVAAMTTGHPGSMSTVHANSAHDAMARLETMLAVAWPSVATSTVRTWLMGALDVVVHCHREESGRRRITEVLATDDYNLHTIYDASDGALCPPPARCVERMAGHGVAFEIERLARVDVA